MKKVNSIANNQQENTSHCPNCWGVLEYGETTENGKAPELSCPNCWGKQEYNGEEKQVKKKHTPVKQGWINAYVTKTLSKK